MRSLQLYYVEWIDNPNLIPIELNPKEDLKVVAYEVIGTPRFLKPVRVRGGAWGNINRTSPLVEVDINEHESASLDLIPESGPGGILIYGYNPKSLPVIIEISPERPAPYRPGQRLILLSGTPHRIEYSMR